MELTWHTFQDRRGERMHVAVAGRHRYMVTRNGWLVVTMKYSDLSIYEGKLRATTNAKLYAAELAEVGGPRS
jgi:hypothetical protein